MHRRQSRVLVLGTLLAMSMGSCGGCDKGPTCERPEPERNPEDKFVFMDDEKKVIWTLELEIDVAVMKESVSKNGHTFREWTDKKGVRHVEVKGPPGNPFRYASETQPDGTEIILYDANGDGRTDKRAEKRPASQTYVLEIDTDGNGVFDERITDIFDLKNKSIHSVFEKRKFGIFWKKMREKTVSYDYRLLIHWDDK